MDVVVPHTRTMADLLEVLDVVSELNRTRGTTVAIVLHDLQAAARVSDHIVVLADGRVHVEGPPRDALTSTTLADVWHVRARVEPCARGQIQVMVDDVL